MGLDLNTLKERWGVTDPALDPLVQMTADQAQALCELYTGRKFDLADDLEEISGVVYALQVRRYPIESVTALWHKGPGQPDAVLAPLTSLLIQEEKGLIFPSVWNGWPGLVRCQYRGGFDPWPFDLEYAVTLAADLVWTRTPGGGAPVGPIGGSQVKKLSVVGVYSAELGDPLATTSGGGGGGDSWGLLSPSIVAVLDKYAHSAVVGIG